jgi:hypothetical protein
MLRNGGRFTPEWVAGIARNQWPEWTGKRSKHAWPQAQPDSAILKGVLKLFIVSYGVQMYINNL